MQKKYRIAIVGIGGVGGFVGGKLAEAFGSTGEVEVIFVARGANAMAVKENGLTLTTSSGTIVVQPDLVSDDAVSIGAIDLLVCCTKTYDLESSIKALSLCITPDTIILPLLNGIDNTEKVQALLPGAKVLQGCIYLVSKLVAPGIVTQRGDFHSLHFGGDKMLGAEMARILDLFGRANISAVLEDNIYEKIWAKFSFISPVATYTSAYNISIGKILESDEHTGAIKKLMAELVMLAATLNISIPGDSIEKNFVVMAKLPYETTSSMQADFANKRLTELETLTGAVVRKAKEQGSGHDSYASVYQLLCERK